MHPIARLSAPARVALVLFGALPATVLGVPALFVVAQGLHELGGGHGGGAGLALLGALGVAGAAGMWWAALEPHRRGAAALVACGVAGYAFLLADALARHRAWFRGLTFGGKDAAELLLVVAPLAAGVAFLALRLRRRPGGARSV